MDPDCSAFEARMCEAGLRRLAIDTFRHAFEALAAGRSGMIPEAEIEPLDQLPTVGDLSDFARLGRAALSDCVVLKLNGASPRRWGSRARSRCCRRRTASRSWT